MEREKLVENSSALNIDIVSAEQLSSTTNFRLARKSPFRTRLPQARENFFFGWKKMSHDGPAIFTFLRLTDFPARAAQFIFPAHTSTVSFYLQFSHFSSLSIKNFDDSRAENDFENFPIIKFTRRTFCFLCRTFFYSPAVDYRAFLDFSSAEWKVNKWSGEGNRRKEISVYTLTRLALDTTRLSTSNRSESSCKTAANLFLLIFRGEGGKSGHADECKNEFSAFLSSSGRLGLRLKVVECV